MRGRQTMLYEVVETSNQETKEDLSSVPNMYQGEKYHNTLDKIYRLYL